MSSFNYPAIIKNFGTSAVVFEYAFVGIQDKNLQTISICSAIRTAIVVNPFLAAWAHSPSLEYLFCYEKTKSKTKPEAEPIFVI